MKPIQLTVNGRSVVESVEARTHLADFLREKLTLTGTHLRCEQGVCGACTLLIDGQPARSCITYAVMCDGAAITIRSSAIRYDSASSCSDSCAHRTMLRFSAMRCSVLSRSSTVRFVT